MQTDILLEEMNPGEADQLSKQHYQYVNIWKPLRGPVLDWGLALCDPTTVEASDYEARDIVRRDSFMETYQIHRRLSHQWYFVSNQTAQEAWLFLQSDSDPKGLKGVPHSAFPNPNQPEYSRYLRESIEVRALVFYGES